MAGVNKVILIGNLGRDPDLKYTQGGVPICRLALATERSWINKQTQERCKETEWHRVTVWGKQAEHCNTYLAKGRSAYVEGRLRTSSYDDKDGIKRYSTEIIADVVQFLGGRSDGESADASRGAGAGGGATNQATGTAGQQPDPPPEFLPPAPEDDDIPF